MGAGLADFLMDVAFAVYCTSTMYRCLSIVFIIFPASLGLFLTITVVSHVEGTSPCLVCFGVALEGLLPAAIRPDSTPLPKLDCVDWVVICTAPIMPEFLTLLPWTDLLWDGYPSKGLMLCVTFIVLGFEGIPQFFVACFYVIEVEMPWWAWLQLLQTFLCSLYLGIWRCLFCFFMPGKRLRVKSYSIDTSSP